MLKHVIHRFIKDFINGLINRFPPNFINLKSPRWRSHVEVNILHLLFLDIFLTNCQHHFFAIFDFAKVQIISLLCVINLWNLNCSSLNRY